jgi:hypothetical protein
MTIEDVLNETYITEETAQMILKTGILGNVIMYGSVNGKEGEKPIAFEDLPNNLKRRFLAAIQRTYEDVTDVETYVKQQHKPVKFAMIGDRIRLVDDGKTRKSRSISDNELRAKYGKA